ncbi:MAG: WYL domain-containing protein [Puniceicoccales bacterium]|jgi:hypothetical protein|nr:WYL domain-containing protein [Puniceicoccales bacterium]
MGNLTKMSFFKTKRRLRFMEQALFWRGLVNRNDIAGEFGLSLAQATADLKLYQQANPSALAYDLGVKCYRWAAGAKPAVHTPDLAEAVKTFSASSAVGLAAPVERFEFPVRTAPLAVQQALFQAIAQERSVQVTYRSPEKGAARELRIAPRAWAHDGHRWHVRAWDFDGAKFGDFALARIERAGKPLPLESPLSEDVAWKTFVVLRVEINPELSELLRRELELDYHTENGVLRVTVNEVMAPYAEKYFKSLWSPEEGKVLFKVSREKPAEAA